jgi:hypothetical protein
MAVARLRAGAKNADVSRELNVPVGTVGYWLHLDRAKRGTLPARRSPPCPRCDSRELDEAAYTYLLALYLGRRTHHPAPRAPSSEPHDHLQ